MTKIRTCDGGCGKEDPLKGDTWIMIQTAMFNNKKIELGIERIFCLECWQEMESAMRREQFRISNRAVTD